jgi:hypothetical protein
MKSPMVTAAPYIGAAEVDGYSDLQVLRSGAGWYVGTTYVNRDENGQVTFIEPGSRDSDYFATEAEAAEFLLRLEHGDVEALESLRRDP